MRIMVEPLRRGSSPVDWCEGNYMISPLIAEFVNTFSNILFFVMPPLLIHLFREYGQCVTRAVHLVWCLLIFVGCSSAYFHATLSLIGQLLDEISILWVLIASISLWIPPRFMPKYFKSNRNHFFSAAFCVGILITCLACIYPAINAFALMMFCFPVLYIMISEMKRCENKSVVRLGVRSSVLGIVAICCWLNDRLFCEVWSKLNFPYLHGVWHLLIFIASYCTCVLFAYFHAVAEMPEQTPDMKFWPNGIRETLGVPYVIFKTKKVTTFKDHPISYGRDYSLESATVNRA